MVDAEISAVAIRWIVLCPLLGAAAQAGMLLVVRRPVARSWVVAFSTAPVLLALAFACVAFAKLITLPQGSRVQTDVISSWVGLGVGKQAFSADLAFRFDTLSGAICLFVIVVSLLVFLYAFAFMEGDARPDAGYQRFFTYMSFVLASLLTLVLAENLLIILAGWVATGLGTAALIGFWYSDPGGQRAAVRSMTFSIALDGVLVACIVILFWSLSSVAAHTASLDDIAAGLPALAQHTLALGFGFEIHTLTLVAAGIGLAACGRAAQLPFWMSLSGVTRSPAPAAAFSVLAASMGIYLCCRLSFLLASAPAASAAIAWVGVLTAVFAAASALAQRDLVAMLVAATVSQFGIAFLAIGSGAYSAAILQLLMTIIVMTLLILSAGSVIHCLDGERDIRRMGGLNARLVLTHLMVVVGVFSPAVFLSREQAVASAFDAQGLPGSSMLFALALLATLLVSWAISRYLVGVFWGSIRTPLGFRGEFRDPPMGFMIAMYGLALFSVLGVALNPAQIWGDLLPGGVEGSDSLARFLGGALEKIDRDALETGLRWELVAASLLATLLGLSTTYLFYVRFPKSRIKLNARLTPLQRVLTGEAARGVLERRLATPLAGIARSWFERRTLRDRVRASGLLGALLDLHPRPVSSGLLGLSELILLAGSLLMLALVYA